MFSPEPQPAVVCRAYEGRCAAAAADADVAETDSKCAKSAAGAVIAPLWW